MANKIIKLSEAVSFARDSGYIFAVYEKKDGKYIIHNECYLSDIEHDTDILVKTNGPYTDFKDFVTTDGRYRFLLHNTFNLKKSLPINLNIQEALDYLIEHTTVHPAPEVE
jgi:hypothetical protein